MRARKTAKSTVIGLVIGLIAGPFISNMVGWQVTRDKLYEEVRAAVVEQQALFCKERARAEVEDMSGLDYGARRDLAEKWAVMPGQESAKSEVISTCITKLAKS